MVPRTTHRVVYHQTFDQWPAVMRAGRANRKKLGPASGHENPFAKRVSQKHPAVSQIVDFASFLEVSALQLV